MVAQSGGILHDFCYQQLPTNLYQVLFVKIHYTWIKADIITSHHHETDT